MTKIEEYTKRIQKTKMPDDWETLPELKPKVNLGRYILENYLQKRGDVIEIDTSDKHGRYIGSLKKALMMAAEKQKATLLFRYSHDYKSLYIKRD